MSPPHVHDHGGTGPDVVWLGSLGSDASMWRPRLDRMCAGAFPARHQAHHQAHHQARHVCVDLPGHGASAGGPARSRIGGIADAVFGRWLTEGYAAAHPDEEIVDLVPGARLEVVPGAHVASRESVDAITRLIVDHLDHLAGRSGGTPG